MSETTMYLVFSNPIEESKEQEFNDWYDRVHVREVLATPGMVSAQRYKLRETEMSRLMGTPAAHRYLVVYEMKEDPDVVMGRISEAHASGSMNMHEALDIESVLMSFWTPVGPKFES